ncbi:MAG: SRPBCC family protein [Byssovorax sp.]
MSFVASASGVIPASRAVCFSHLLDFAGWEAWMPPSFRPRKGPSRLLQVGDRLELVITAKPKTLPLFIRVRIVRVEQDREITWRGGVPGLVVGEHAFFFEDAEGKPGATLVRSEETWSGALTSLGFAAKRIRESASRIGREQIEALGAALAKSG